MRMSLHTRHTDGHGWTRIQFNARTPVRGFLCDSAPWRLCVKPNQRSSAVGSTSPQPSPQRGEGVRVRPDFTFRKERVVVFVDGCFWHGCPKHGTQPKGNASFWRRKFSANKNRDRLVNLALRRADIKQSAPTTHHRTSTRRFCGGHFTKINSPELR